MTISLLLAIVSFSILYIRIKSITDSFFDRKDKKEKYLTSIYIDDYIAQSYTFKHLEFHDKQEEVIFSPRVKVFISK